MSAQAPSKLSMRGAISTIIMLTAAGCAVFGTDMTGARESWSGQPYREVEAQWGTPTRTEELPDGRLARTWVSEGRLSRVSPTFGIFGGTGGAGVGAAVSTQPSGPMSRCERTLIFSRDRVVKQEWQGDDNYCSTFVRY